MSQFREAHKEMESGKKSTKMTQKRKKKEAENDKVGGFGYTKMTNLFF